MNRFRVGDRVVVYGWVQMHHKPYEARAGGRATVVWASGPNPFVQFDKAMNGKAGGDCTHYAVHPKQCRRLKKKERRVLKGVWEKVPFEGGHSIVFRPQVPFADLIELIGRSMTLVEVRRKG